MTSKPRVFVTLAAAASLSWSAPLLLSMGPSSYETEVRAGSDLKIEEVEVPAPSFSPLVRIAHAGGALDGQTYTNSLEALAANRDYFEFFEIDLEFTSDGILVCIHDWEQTAERILGRQFDEPPSHAVFLSLAQENAGFTPCDISTLGAWARENPGKRIITDIKGDNIAGLREIAKNQDLAWAVIPQVYEFEEIEPARRLGFDDVILTIYRFPKIPDDFSMDERLGDLFAVTFPRRHAIELGPKLRSQLPEEVLVLTHPISDEEAANNVQRFGVQGIYTTLKNFE